MLLGTRAFLGSASVPLAVTATLLSLAPVARAQNAAASSTSPSTETSVDDMEHIEHRLEADERRLRELERRQHEHQQLAPKESAVARWGSKGLAIASADGSNVLRLGALVQADGRYFTDSTTSSTSNTWLLRRVRPILLGTLDDIYDFKLMPDFGGGKTIVQDAFISARFKPWLTVTVGKFKPSVGLERLQSAADNRFIERGMPTDLVPNRDIGVQLGGDLASGRVNYSVGLFNGVADGTSSDTNSTPDFGSAGKGDVAARIFLRPFLLSANPALSGLGFGVAGTYIRATGSP